MAKNKHYRIEGRFILDFAKFVCAETEAKAIRKARDSVIKNRKIRSKEFQRDTVNVFSCD